MLVTSWLHLSLVARSSAISNDGGRPGALPLVSRLFNHLGISISLWLNRGSSCFLVRCRFYFLNPIFFIPCALPGPGWARLNNEAGLLYEKGQYDGAVVLLKNAVEIARKEWGDDHTNVARSPDNFLSLNTLLSFMKLWANRMRRESLFTRSLAIL